MREIRETRRYRQVVYLQSGLVLAGALLMIFFTVLFFSGTLLYHEFCVWNTRIGLERFNSLRATYIYGKEKQGWRDVSLISPFGYELKGTYLPNPSPSNKTVIFLHGLTASRLMGLWYADMYMKAGYNVLLYDARAHGESGGTGVTYGYYEKYDLDEWVKWVKQLQPEGTIGVHGVSMGAATALQHAVLNEEAKGVAFYIVDSAYSDLEELLALQINGVVKVQPAWLVTVLLKASSLAAYVFADFTYEKVSPLAAVRQVTTPLLFLHGEKDVLVPVEMSRQLYRNGIGHREIYTFANAGHATAIFKNKEGYRTVIYRFIEQLSGKRPN